MLNYQLFSKNEKGRDFIVGDIHGCFDSLDAALRHIGFNDDDRLFSIGDLIDRGPQSHRALAFLKRPNFFAIRGNHEDTFLEMFIDGELDWEALNGNLGYGVHWAVHQDIGFLKELRDYFQKLPLAIEIETASGQVGLVHADVLEGLTWQEFVEDIQNDNPEVIYHALNGRSRLSRKNDQGIMGIDRVYFGHTPLGRIKTENNCVYIDTGHVDKATFRQYLARMPLCVVQAGTSQHSLDKANMTLNAFQVVADPQNTLFPDNYSNPHKQNQQMATRGSLFFGY